MSLGVVFALLGAFSFSLNSVTMRRGISRGAASQGLYVTVFLGAGLFVVASVVSGQLFDLGSVTANDFVSMAASGVVHILGGRYCNYRAMGAIGANRAQPIVGMATLASVMIAVVFLGETLNALQGVGIALVMVGPALVMPGRRSAPQAVPAGGSGTVVKAFQPKMVEGYSFGVLAALFWGAGPVLMRAGVESNGLGILGGTVSYLAATLVLSLTLLIPGQASGALSLDKSARKLFFVAGLGSGFANGFRFSALALAPVSVVIPLMRATVLFTLVLNFAFNRHLESFEPKVLIGIFISMIGAILLVI
ncbi:MAG: DMT family transporter [Chloroflexi bacterium]|nr:DMT family transporter [Chloroflexota bacterium]